MALRGLDDAIAVRVTHPVWARTRPGDENDTHCGWVFVDADAERARASPSGRGAFVVPNSDPRGPEGVESVRELYDRRLDGANRRGTRYACFRWW